MLDGEVIVSREFRAGGRMNLPGDGCPQRPLLPLCDVALIRWKPIISSGGVHALKSVSLTALILTEATDHPAFRASCHPHMRDFGPQRIMGEKYFRAGLLHFTGGGMHRNSAQPR